VRATAEQTERDVRRLFGERDAQIAQPLQQQRDALEALGRSEQALAELERAREVLALGTGDDALETLGGRLQRADPTATPGPQQPRVAQAHVTLGRLGTADLALPLTAPMPAAARLLP
jgi:hypothetical protein